jgi:hypothetical protein
MPVHSRLHPPVSDYEFGRRCHAAALFGNLEFFSCLKVSSAYTLTYENSTFLKSSCPIRTTMHLHRLLRYFCIQNVSWNIDTVAVRKKCKLLYNFCAIILSELNKLCTTTDAVFISPLTRFMVKDRTSPILSVCCSHGPNIL